MKRRYSRRFGWRSESFELTRGCTNSVVGSNECDLQATRGGTNAAVPHPWRTRLGDRERVASEQR
jgi:hypothetical protein